MRTISAIILAIFSATYVSAQQDEQTSASPIRFEASYIGENMNNLRGGIKKGSCYLGMANIMVSFFTENSKLWSGGQFHVNASNTHGDTPSQDFIGDTQVASNIEAGNHTFLQELWYKHTLGKHDITIGLQNLNNDFANTSHGALFINSSFGIHSTISNNIPAPIYPLTAFGLSYTWHVGEQISWLASAYDGCPTDFDKNPYNLKWQLKKSDATLFVSEFQIPIMLRGYNGTLKTGLYSHYYLFENNVSDATECVNNYGFYMVADQSIWQKSENREKLGIFLQMSISPSNLNENNFYLGYGFTYNGIFSMYDKDVLGFAIAYAKLNNSIGHETSLELTYKTEINNHIFIQPDLQYIINPAGIGIRLQNSLEGTVRVGLTF